MKRTLLAAFCVLLMAPAMGIAQESVKPEVIVDGLNNPSGVAIQPGTGHVFVADSGALRVVRIIDGKIENVITDFPKDVYGTGPKYDIGPLGLAFIDQNTLVVGGGGLPDGEELLRVYKIPAAGSEAIKADAMEGEGFKLAPSDGVVGEGNFYGVVKTDTGIFVTCNGDDEKGWIAKADLNAGKLSNFRRFIPTKVLLQVDAPVGITVSPEGYLAVGQMGEISVEGDSLLTFYNEKGEYLDKFSTGLNDISALAYGPKRGRLYVTDFNWLDTTKGGLFKLVDDNQNDACKAISIAALDKPTAMVFDAEGNLYVTVCGTTEEGADKPGGQLLMFKGLDEDPNAKPGEEEKKEEADSEDKSEEKSDDDGDGDSNDGDGK